MFRINTLTKVLDLFGLGKHGFRDGNRALAVPATDFSADWCNTIQEEICNVIEASGIALDANNRSQLLQAIQQMVIGAQKAVIINNADFEASVADGKPVRWDSANNRFDESIADGSANNRAVGIADVANSKVYLYGECPLFVGLTPGARYYLDAATPGAITTVAPADGVVVGIAKSATTLFVDVDAQYTSVQASVVGAAKNLKIDSIGVNNYNVVVTADEVVLKNSADGYLTVRAVNKTINANGVLGSPLSIMSARAASTWYFGWLWYNAAQGLTATLDVSATAPTAPTGYVATDYKALLPGPRRTDSSGGTYLLQMQTKGRRTQYVPLAGSNLTALPAMASGSAGTWGPTTFSPVAVAVANFVPSTAGVIGLLAFNAASNGVGVAPNTTYGGYQNTNPAPLTVNGGYTMTARGDFLLESGNVYYAAGASSGLQCLGWEDF